MSLFTFDGPNAREAKTSVHVGRLPAYIDPKQPPTKKSPWRTINDVPFLRNVCVLLPEELYDVIWNAVEEQSKKAQYFKVILKLQDVLDGAFFTEYIKKGDVLMLSEGRPGIDNVFSLRNGILRLDVDKESYLRCGLQGQPVSAGGRKHVKARYLIEIELRKPSMLHGKKGFQRLVYAAKNVLDQSLTWLFCDLNAAEGQGGSSPIDQHHPTMVEGHPKYSIVEHVLIPPFPQVFLSLVDPTVPETFHAESAYEILEWLGLVELQSPRVLRADDIDQFLSQYTVPEGSTAGPKLTIIEWQGLISARWLTKMLNTFIYQSRIQNTHQWLAISASAHRTEAVGQRDGYSIILLPEEVTSQEEDIDMHAASEQAESVTQKTLTGSGTSRSEKHFGGLQNYMCFEHIDAIVGS